MSAAIAAVRGRDGRLIFTPAGNQGFKWTDKLDARLRILAPDYSATSIGVMLGVSRNAVIGRCHRKSINLKKTVAVEPTRKPPRPKVARSPSAPDRPKAFATFGGETDAAKVDQIAAARAVHREAQMVAPSEDWTPARVAFLDIRDGFCRWPLWTGRPPLAEKFFCGNPIEPGSPYCEHCRRIGTAPRAQIIMDRRLGVDKARAAA